MSKKEAQPLEIADDESIDVMTNYDWDNPLRIEDEDPSMRYFFAANDGDKSRPDGVDRVRAMGYTVSAKKHGSTDCTLMEIPKELWECRDAAKRAKRRRARNVTSQVEDQAQGSAVRLKKDGGYYRS